MAQTGGRKRGASAIDAAVHEYVVSHSVRPDAALQALQEESLKHSRSGMLSPPDSIAILQLLLRLTSAKTAVEVGCFTGICAGYTALGLALGLPEGGKLYTLDISSEYPKVGKPYWEQAGVFKRIELIEGPASDSLKHLIKELGPGSVDLGFIDADKPNYDTYYEQLLELVRPGGVIVIDNVLWNGRVVDDTDDTRETQAIKALNTKVFEDSRVQVAILKNSDGITVAYKL